MLPPESCAGFSRSCRLRFNFFISWASVCGLRGVVSPRQSRKESTSTLLVRQGEIALPEQHLVPLILVRGRKTASQGLILFTSLLTAGTGQVGRTSGLNVHLSSSGRTQKMKIRIRIGKQIVSAPVLHTETARDLISIPPLNPAPLKPNRFHELSSNRE
jgi:hypothetical protein